MNAPLLRFWVEVGAVTMYSPRTRPVIAEPSCRCATGAENVIRPPPAATSACQPLQTRV
ncbi:MAG TPA: hypothetical protein VHW23_31185 [Kofleriaceae bacterium]|nr:hypothetical protein [Kofleriaceae bacterium]